MKIKEITPPRQFEVGHDDGKLTLNHVLDLTLDPDEQVTLTTPEGREFDVVRKSWGYYATPSLNGRLKSFGYRSALIKSGAKRFVLFADADKLDEFHAYLTAQNMQVLCWLDGDEIEWVNHE